MTEGQTFYHDLLPELCAEAIAQGLDLMHGIEHDSVVQVLGIKSGELPEEEAEFQKSRMGL